MRIVDNPQNSISKFTKHSTVFNQFYRRDINEKIYAMYALVENVDSYY